MQFPPSKEQSKLAETIYRSETTYRYVTDHMTRGDILMLARLFLSREHQQPYDGLDDWG